MMDIVIYEGKGTDEIGQMNRLEVNGELVLTTVQLAQFFSCSTQAIVKTFHRNKSDFIEGEHFFKLEGEDLRNFKRKMTDCTFATNCTFAVINPNAHIFYLWTALGAARFAKSLRTKKAWAVYEQLVVNYFKTLPDKQKNSSKNELTAKEKVDRLIRLAKITKNEAVRENLIATAEKLIIGI